MNLGSVFKYYWLTDPNNPFLKIIHHILSKFNFWVIKRTHSQPCTFKLFVKILIITVQTCAKKATVIVSMSYNKLLKVRTCNLASPSLSSTELKWRAHFFHQKHVKICVCTFQSCHVYTTLKTSTSLLYFEATAQSLTSWNIKINSSFSSKAANEYAII